MSAAAARASSAEYGAFAERVRASGLITDPWLDGAPRLRPEPVVLSRARAAALARAAEDVASLHHEVARACDADPSLLDSFFGLTPFQKAMWLSSAPRWHGIARADAFITDDGVRVCELNSDTPSGEAEAVVLNALAAEERPDLADPNAGLERRFVAMVEAIARARGPRLSVGLVYPTELTEDLSMIGLYARWLEARGHEVTLGSPYNLEAARDGGVTLLGRPCDAVVRHYKTDWWGERESPWDDDPGFADGEPLDAPLRALLGAVIAGRCAVVNPFGAVLTQNKRAMAFLWERIDHLPARARAAVRARLPYTARLEACDLGALANEREAWVLKSDYGCEGEEVVIGRECDPEEWRAALAHARPRRWIAQRRFEAIPDDGGGVVNHGVYVIGGVASGFYARVQDGATDARAASVATLVERRAARR